MPATGEYRPDPTEGTTRIEDLPKTKVACQNRNYRKRPCPRCGHRSYRDRLVHRRVKPQQHLLALLRLTLRG